MDKKVFWGKLKMLGFSSVLELSQKSGIHRNTINQYLNGRGVFKGSFERLSSFLNIDPYELIIPVSKDLIAIENSKEILSIIGLLLKNTPDSAIVLLGSRANNRAKSGSDWDIGITCQSSPITGMQYLKLKNLVDDATQDLIHGVDLINLDEAPVWFLKEINYDPIMLGGDNDSYIHLKGVIDGIKKGNAA